MLLLETKLRTGAFILPGEIEARLCGVWINSSLWDCRQRDGDIQMGLNLLPALIVGEGL